MQMYIVFLHRINSGAGLSAENCKYTYEEKICCRTYFCISDYFWEHTGNYDICVCSYKLQPANVIQGHLEIYTICI
jgi:hypothetical protein